MADLDARLFDDVPAVGELPPSVSPAVRGARRAVDGQDRGTYVILRRQFRLQCESRQAPCHVCDQPIDYRFRHGSPWAWELDHFEPVASHPELALVASNFRASHSRCNKRRGLLEGPAGEAEDELGDLSENW